MKNLSTPVIVKQLTITIGALWGAWIFLKGFGLEFTMTNNDPVWVFHYVDTSLWLVFPSVVIGYFIPRLAAVLLTLGVLCSSFLVLHHWGEGMSLITAYNLTNGYTEWAVVARVAAPMLLLASSFLYLGFNDPKRMKS